MRMIRSMLAVSVLIGAVTWSAGALPAAPPEQDTLIDAVIVAPPSVASDLGVRLLLDGVDVTETYCDSLDDAGRGPGITCPDVAEGEYEFVVDGVPDDHQIDVQCTDVVAARRSNPVITLEGGFWNWSCNVYVAPRTILVDVGATSGPDEPGPDDILITGPDGTIDNADCEPAVFNDGADRLWCTDLTPGDYTVTVETPDGFRSRVYCFPIPDTFDLEITADGLDEFTVSDDQWLWSCSGAEIVPPVMVTVDAVEIADTEWLGDVAVSATIGDTTVDCVRSSLFLDDAAEFGFAAAAFDCLGLPDGDVTVAAEGIPGDLIVDGPSCEPATVSAEVESRCSIVVSSTEPFVPTEPSTTILGPSLPTELPVTGANSTLAAWATVMVAAGVLALLAARRRALRP